MAKYIDGEAAIRMLSHPVTMSMCLDIDECTHKRSQREIDLELIKSIPAAHVQPVLHGRWVTDDDRCVSCSECGNPAEVNGITGEFMESPYCSECGARMDGET